MLTTLGMGAQTLTTFGMGEVLAIEEQPVLRGRKRKRLKPVFAMLLREDDELLAILSGATS